MITLATLLPTLTLAKYPLTLTGAVLVFGLSSQAALTLVSVNAGKMTQPVAWSADFNLPPVTQLADLTPITVEPVKPRNDGGSSIVTLAAPTQVTQVALAPTNAASISDLAPPTPTGALRPGRIGPKAVNIRAGSSKEAAKLGSIEAGTPVMIGRTQGGWVEVQFQGGSGWVYSSYLETGTETEVTVDYGDTTSTAAAITVRGGQDPSGSGKLVEAGSSMVARAEPRSEAERLFRIEPGERLRIVERDGGWAKVTTVTGESGWVRLG